MYPAEAADDDARAKIVREQLAAAPPTIPTHLRGDRPRMHPRSFTLKPGSLSRYPTNNVATGSE
jgi:hypothetical protein